MRRQVAVLGLGRFGSAVARELARLGHDVLVVDADERLAQDLAPDVSHAAQADITDREALQDLGLAEFDTAIVAVSSRLEVSILATALLKRLGSGGSWPRPPMICMARFSGRSAPTGWCIRSARPASGWPTASPRRACWTISTWRPATGSPECRCRKRGSARASVKLPCG
jgi:voltage-gated potassium channel Kch